MLDNFGRKAAAHLPTLLVLLGPLREVESQEQGAQAQKPPKQ
jgi:hypothetical protein